LAFIWPFSLFENLAFLKLLMAKFALFYFLGPGNPATTKTATAAAAQNGEFSDGSALSLG
jgi:hypothetical protein